MSIQNFFLFFPERMLWIGVSVLFGLFLMASPFLALHWGGDSLTIETKSTPIGDRNIHPLSFSLGLSEAPPPLPVPDLQGEMTFSFDPPRPDGALHRPQLLVRLKKSSQSKRVSLPSRLHLQYVEGEKLIFPDEETPFWVELSAVAGGQIEARTYIETLRNGKVEVGSFCAIPQTSPIQSSQEFLENSPFRLLSEARWWGRDLFREKYGGSDLSERLEVGPPSQTDLIEVCVEDWLVWQEGRWQKISSPTDGKTRPIAHIQSILGKSLFVEGWENDHHIRLCLSPAACATIKIRGEDLFSSIRVRSEKQISCMLEKQCLVLKTGDWVLKTDGRWKILRKKEEREAYLLGKLLGDLFVFDKIELKQGQKYIQGTFFNSGRSQTLLIEMVASVLRKGAKDPVGVGEKSGRKGKLR